MTCLHVPHVIGWLFHDPDPWWSVVACALPPLACRQPMVCLGGCPLGAPPTMAVCGDVSVCHVALWCNWHWWVETGDATTRPEMQISSHENDRVPEAIVKMLSMY